MYGSASGANPLLMQAFRGSGSGSSGSSSSRSSPFPTPNPPAFSHTRSFSTSSHHTAAHSTLSSPGLSYASLNDGDMLSLSSPIGFPDLYPVPATNSSESSEILLTRVDGLGRDLNFMQGEIRGLRSTLEIVLEATRNPTNEAPWIRLASDAFRGQTLILAKSPQLAQLKQYPLVRFWTPADFDTDSDSAPRTKIKKSAGGTDKKNDVNNEGQYVEHADGTVVGGIEFGQVRECANHLFFDLLAAGRATRKLAHIGEHVRSALIYMLELRYPHLGLCVEHWKALRIVQDRYRFWAAPF
ncbi:hypothetical protein B0H10DRAFT_2445901 [Mycena sp. CBHHK59/15]|nr:hypothetical protein B0H10DRAFT_2445901 [Mycena sp. CBHHK59/15]